MGVQSGADQKDDGAKDPDTEPFKLSQLQQGQNDKLGHKVEEILWIGQNYKVYRTDKTVYVHFSDVPADETKQRKKFTEISPELCELRHLTYQLDDGSGWSNDGQRPSTLYHHNMAQALMLVMEDKCEDGKKLAKQALDMAVKRVTVNNTVRYLTMCLQWWGAFMIVGAVLLFWLSSGSATSFERQMRFFVVAAMSGATGAVLSVATRLQTFEPCNQSNMNNWMSRTRIFIGLLAGMILLLFGATILQKQFASTFDMTKWEAVVVLGLIAGFAERLIPNLLRQRSEQLEKAAGTPVQALREQAAKAAGTQ